MKKLLLLLTFIAIFIILKNNILYATDAFIVKKIYFEGLQRLPTNKILSNIPFYIGDKITNDTISKTIKILFSTGNFENIKILQDQNTIIIQVKEHPLIAHITFNGNKSIKNDILINNLKLQGLQEGKFFHKEYILKIEETLKNFYYDIGKYNTTIKTQIAHLPNNKVNIKIIFSEGKSATVQKINIIGNKQFSTNQLLKIFQSHNTFPGINRLFKKKYQKKIFLRDLKSLRHFYLNKGFAKFNISSTQINITPDKKNIYLTVYITEGLQYKISDVSVDENTSQFSSKIHTLLTIHPNEFYNYKKIQNFTQNIKKLLGNYGYIHPNIITELETDNINKTVRLYINIKKGKCFYVNKIKFEGNNFTNDSVLRREIRQMEKTWVNNNLINQGQNQLNRIGYFESVKNKNEYIPMTSDQVNIIYTVKERNSGNININVGIGTGSGINFQCGIQQENLFGTGNSFILHATKNHYQTYTELSANHPYLTINNASLEEKIFYNNFTADNANLADYALKSYGMNFSTGFPVNEHNRLHFNLDYIHNNLSNIKPQIAIWRYLLSQGIYPKIILNKNASLNITNKKTFNDIQFNSNDIFFTVNWKHNTLNHAYFPTYGSYFDCFGKITIPGSNNEYYKIIINSSYYLPLCKNSDYWILIGRVYTGYTGGLHKKENPFYDNFYSGGNNMVRGFRPNTIGPKAVYYKCTIKDHTYDTCSIENSQDAIGGNAITILKSELIIPTPFLSKKYINIIRSTIFTDLGTVWDTYWKNTIITQEANIPNYKNPKNIRVSNGIAIQWISPIGPIVFSYAKFIKKYEGDKIEQFQFNIGKIW